MMEGVVSSSRIPQQEEAKEKTPEIMEEVRYIVVCRNCVVGNI